MESRIRRIKRVAVVTGSRAEYGILRPLMHVIKEHGQFDLLTLAVGMHLSSEFGNTIEEIKKDGFAIDGRISAVNKKDTNEAMARYIGRVIIRTVDIFKYLKPDVVMLLGDRVDIFATAVAAAYMNIAIAHIHGGDVSHAGLDEPARHSITKFAHIHFPATRKSAERIIEMGEDPNRVFVVGAPGLDSILKKRLPSPKYISKKYNMDLSQRILLLVQHPVTTQTDSAEKQIEETLRVIKQLKCQTVVIYPNADAGGRKMIQAINQYTKKCSFIHAYKNIPHDDYLGILSVASVIIGNSSSGIIEAPSFKLPVVNIGIRQKGRERSTNVIDVPHNRYAIVEAINKALNNKKFREKLKKCKNPYGDGKTSQRIVDILSKIKIGNKLLQKKITF